MTFLQLSKLHENINEKTIKLGPWCGDIEDYLSNSDDYLVNYNKVVNEEKKYLEYTNLIVKELLLELHSTLNKIHKKNFKYEFWQIVLSTWLTMIINTMHQIYLGLLKLEEIEQSVETTIDAFFPYDYLYQPKTNSGAIIDQNYLHGLSSFIIREGNFKKINYVEVPVIKEGYDSWFQILKRKQRKEIFFKKFLKNSFYKIQKSFNPKHLMYFFETNDPVKLIKLKLKLPEIMFSYKEFTPEVKKRPIEEKKFLLKKRTDQFFNIVKKFIEINIPKTVFENFGEMIAGSSDYRNKISAVGSSGFYSDWQLFELALVRENNGETVIFEEGMSTVCEKHSQFNFFFNTNTYFFSWSKKKLVDNIENINITPLRFSHKKKSEKRSDEILYYPAAQALGPDIYSTHNFPCHKQYYKNKIDFIKILNSSELKEKLIIKPKAVQQLKIGSEDLSLMKIHKMKYNISYDGSKNLNNCKLLYIDNLSSAIIEAFYLNTPIHIFIDFELYGIAKYLLPSIKNMRREGIFFDDVSKAANSIIEKYDYIEKIWQERRIQNLRNDFLNSYLSMDKEWSQSLKLGFKRIENLNKAKQ